jgi:hypothetical protein
MKYPEIIHDQVGRARPKNTDRSIRRGHNRQVGCDGAVNGIQS